MKAESNIVSARPVPSHTMLSGSGSGASYSGTAIVSSRRLGELVNEDERGRHPWCSWRHSRNTDYPSECIAPSHYTNRAALTAPSQSESISILFRTGASNGEEGHDDPRK